MINYRIRKLRMKRGLLAKEVADILRIDRGQFYAVTSGHEKTKWIRKRISWYFNKSQKWLFGEEAYVNDK